MSHTLQPTLQCLEGHFDRKTKHHFSFIIESDGKFYELKHSYLRKYPASWVDDARLWVRMRRRTVKRTCENLARQTLQRSQTSYDKVRYVTTVSRGASVHQRHITIVQIPALYLEDLLKNDYLRLLRVDGAQSRTDQARSAVLGLSVVTASVESILVAQRQVAAN